MICFVVQIFTKVQNFSQSAPLPSPLFHQSLQTFHQSATFEHGPGAGIPSFTAHTREAVPTRPYTTRPVKGPIGFYRQTCLFPGCQACVKALGSPCGSSTESVEECYQTGEFLLIGKLECDFPFPLPVARKRHRSVEGRRQMIFQQIEIMT